ncbi:hypothetical protein AAC387_Pa04g2900 [Persea americana]
MVKFVMELIVLCMKKRQVTPLTLQKKKEDCREGEDFKGSLRQLSTKLMFATSLEEQREHRSRTGEKK